MSGKDCWNKCVFSFHQNTSREAIRWELTCFLEVIWLIDNAYLRLRVRYGRGCSDFRCLLSSPALFTNLYRLQNAEHILCKLLPQNQTFDCHAETLLNNTINILTKVHKNFFMFLSLTRAVGHSSHHAFCRLSP